MTLLIFLAVQTIQIRAVDIRWLSGIAGLLPITPFDSGLSMLAAGPSFSSPKLTSASPGGAAVLLPVLLDEDQRRRHGRGYSLGIQQKR
jgi:hypothetical protein